MRSLPRGRHKLSREVVREHQRRRIIAAIGRVLKESGYEGATVAAICRIAKVSKSDFYVQFGDKDECFLAAYDDAIEGLRADALKACAGEDGWAEGVCAALAALAATPTRADLLLVEGLRAGPKFYELFRQAIESFVPHLREGAPVPADRGQQPDVTDEAVVGGIASLLERRVSAGEAGQLDRFFPELAEFALTPYVGVAEARRIISTR